MTSKPFVADDIVDLTNHVAIVTGGNRSIGLETTYLLLRKNCTVWIAGRSPSGLDEAKKTLSARADISEDMLSRLFFLSLDLSEMKKARLSAQSFEREHSGRLDIVIANAGVSLQRSDEISSDGYEKTMQTNHLGHFAFITGLLPLLEKTAREHGKASVVMTSSDAHAFAKDGIDFESLKTSKPHRGFRGLGDGFKRYGASKLANMLFARELDKRWAEPLRKSGVLVAANCAHPGTILNTGLGGNGEDWGIPGFVNRIVRASSYIFGFSTLEGAMTQIYVATSPEIWSTEDHGRYYVPVTTWRGRYYSSRAQKPDTKWGEDDELAAKLWEFSEDALKKAIGESD
ncbi:hypothetical protein FRC18_011456 [Serendipita sp. 400]|nr:hypothetical protein FRC18_011456 [Serendipita sp. 400]